MDKDKRMLLRKKRLDLIHKLNVDEEFLAASSMIFPDAIMENIKVKDTKTKRADIYLDELPKRGPGKFEMFIEALFDTRQEHVAKILGYDKDPRDKGTAPTGSPEQVGGSGVVTEETLRVIYEDENCKKKQLGSPRRAPLRPNDSLDAGLGEVGGEQEEEPPLPDKWPGDKVGPVKTDVTPMRNKDRARAVLERRVGNGHVYDLMLGQARAKGRAIIVHNHMFSAEGDRNGLKNREGSRFDEMALTSLFKNLEIEYLPIYEDNTAEEIRNALQTESLNPNLADIPMLFVVVMSHGAQNVIFGKDGGEVTHQYIINRFDSRHCPLLCGKPKIFLFQACQGNKAAVDLSSMMQAMSLDGNRQEPDATPVGAGAGAGDEEAGPGGADEFYPSIVGQHEDMLLVKASLPGHSALRDTERGTWFIQAFAEVVSQRAHLLDMLTLLTRVKQLVGKAKTSKGYIQTTNSWSTLQKELCLYPGLR